MRCSSHHFILKNVLHCECFWFFSTNILTFFAHKLNAPSYERMNKMKKKILWFIFTYQACICVTMNCRAFLMIFFFLSLSWRESLHIMNSANKLSPLLYVFNISYLILLLFNCIFFCYKINDKCQSAFQSSSSLRFSMIWPNSS